MAAGFRPDKVAGNFMYNSEMEPRLIEILRNSRLFNGVKLELLPLILQRSIKRSVEEDGYFFFQNDQASHAYILTEGRVKMLQITTGGQQIALRIITPGETYGGIALLNPPNGYPASALAMENSSALAWDTQTMRELVNLDPLISLNTMQIMHSYIEDLQSRQSALISERVDQRIARTLLKLASQAGRKTDEGVLIDIPLTRQDVAEMSGTTLYTVSRTLSEWERQGIVKIGRGRVAILQPHGLVKIAEDR
jgi:CRP-like cAMP-binding protein